MVKVFCQGTTGGWNSEFLIDPVVIGKVAGETIGDVLTRPVDEATTALLDVPSKGFEDVPV